GSVLGAFGRAVGETLGAALFGSGGFRPADAFGRALLASFASSDLAALTGAGFGAEARAFGGTGGGACLLALCRRDGDALLQIAADLIESARVTVHGGAYRGHALLREFDIAARGGQ